MNEEIEREVDAYDQRVYGGKMTAQQRKRYRDLLIDELRRSEMLGELSLKDYLASDEGMHWSDNK